MTKRIIDFLAALLGLVIFSPLFAIVAVGIKIDSHGPVFFRQVRMGKKGRAFRIFKFRTMVHQAERLGSAITVANDHRVTRIGGFLRRYKLDELPQLLNVLLGEMSLVGPRPELPKYQDHYSGRFEAVLNVRPGMTDPASLSYRNESELLTGQPDPESYYIREILPRKLKINLNYLASASLRTDMQIIFATIFVSMRPRWTTRFSYLHGVKKL